MGRPGLHPGRRYPVRAATAHPIMENFRVEAFRAIMQGCPTATAAQLSLGELMFQSHSSYRCAGPSATQPCSCMLAQLEKIA